MNWREWMKLADKLNARRSIKDALRAHWRAALIALPDGRVAMGVVKVYHEVHE